MHRHNIDINFSTEMTRKRIKCWTENATSSNYKICKLHWRL